jgi:hypothetical protein
MISLSKTETIEHDYEAQINAAAHITNFSVKEIDN